MNELLDALKTISLVEINFSIYEYRVVMYAPWGVSQGTTVSLTAKTPQEMTQEILRMTGEANNV